MVMQKILNSNATHRILPGVIGDHGNGAVPGYARWSRRTEDDVNP